MNFSLEDDTFSRLTIEDRLKRLDLPSNFISILMENAEENDVDDKIKDIDLYVFIHIIYISVEDNLTSEDRVDMNLLMRKMNLNIKKNELSSKITGRFTGKTKMGNVFNIPIVIENTRIVIEKTYDMIICSIEDNNGEILYNDSFKRDVALKHIEDIINYSISLKNTLSNTKNKILCSVFICIYLDLLVKKKMLINYRHSKNKISEIIGEKGGFDACYSDIKKFKINDETLIDLCKKKLNLTLENMCI